MSHRAHLITAAVNFSLTAYATLTVAAVKLLHCTWVPGTPKAQRHLVIHGSVRCDYSGWQLPYVVLVGLLIAVPVGLPMVAAWARRSGSSGLGVEGASGSCMEDVRNGLRRALVDAYQPRAYWFEAVLMLMRLVRISVELPQQSFELR
jgi:hypothetical protein